MIQQPHEYVNGYFSIPSFLLLPYTASAYQSQSARFGFPLKIVNPSWFQMLSFPSLKVIVFGFFTDFFKLKNQLKLRHSRSISTLAKQSQKMKMGPQSSKFWSLWRFILDGRAKVLLEIRENYKICSCNVLQSSRYYTPECCVSKSWESSQWSSRRRWWLTIFSEDNKQ